VDPILQIINGLKKALAEVDEVILSGRISSFDEYKKYLGKREGFVDALQAVDLALKEDSED
jgi:hypothetical protein